MRSHRRSRLLAACSPAVGLVAVLGLAPWTTASAQTPDPTVRLTTPYPALLVEPGSDIKLDLSAAAPQPERVDLAVEGLPDGWKATLRGGGFVISGLTAAPDPPAKAQLELAVPPTAAPGSYPSRLSSRRPRAPAAWT